MNDPNIYFVQCAYKTNAGKLQIEWESFEAGSSKEALAKATQYFAEKLKRGIKELLFSTPQREQNTTVHADGGRSVVIGGSMAGAQVITGSGNVVIR
jgi:hypothetical protein